MNHNEPDDPSEVTSPRQARRRFIASKRGTVKDSTTRAYKYPTKSFVQFCESRRVETTGEIGGHVIGSWKRERQREVAPVTLQNNVKHLLVFVRWCESMELIDYGTADRVKVPDISKKQQVSDETVRVGQAENVLHYLDTYEYASREHALFKLMWDTGCRIGGALALDLDDFDHKHPRQPRLYFRDRRDEGTGLKNGESGERDVMISDQLVAVLIDYISAKRDEVTDEYGRHPLFTTPNGRLYRQKAYNNLVPRTRPCVTTGMCPHDREEAECDAAQSVEKAPSCPSSKSLHPIRRGSITNQINLGWDKSKLSERVDVSVPVLDKHYDDRKLEEEARGREEFTDLL